MSGWRRRRAGSAGSLCSPLYSAARAALEISASVAALRIVADQSNRSNPADAGGAGILAGWAEPLKQSAELVISKGRRTRPDACGDVVYDSSHRSRARRPVQVPFFALRPPRTRDDQAASKERGTSKRAIFLALHLRRVGPARRRGPVRSSYVISLLREPSSFEGPRRRVALPRRRRRPRVGRRLGRGPVAVRRGRRPPGVAGEGRRGAAEERARRLRRRRGSRRALERRLRDARRRRPRRLLRAFYGSF